MCRGYNVRQNTTEILIHGNSSFYLMIWYFTLATLLCSRRCWGYTERLNTTKILSPKRTVYQRPFPHAYFLTLLANGCTSMEEAKGFPFHQQVVVFFSNTLIVPSICCSTIHSSTPHYPYSHLPLSCKILFLPCVYRYRYASFLLVLFLCENGDSFINLTLTPNQRA